MKLFKEDNESMLNYLKRLVDGYRSKIYDIDYPDIIKLVFDVELSRDESRKRFYGIEMVLELIEMEVISNLEGEELLKEIEEKTRAMYKERVKLQTEKLEYNKWNREEARYDLFEEKVLDRIKDFVLLPKPNHTIPRTIGSKGMILTLADIHYGKEIEIYDLFGNILNKYNEKIFEERMWTLFRELKEIVIEEKMKHINIFNLSDSIDGILRMSQLQSLRMGIVDSVIGFSEFMSQWLNELSNYVRLDYYSSLGNHNEIRPLGSKNGDFPHENTERLITHYIKTALRNNSNVIIHDAKNYNYVDIANHKIMATHGQNEKDLEKSIKDYTLTYGARVDMLLTGHYHSSHEKVIGATSESNIEFIQSPSLCGTDEYALKLNKNSKAGAKVLVLEENKKRKITYDIVLN